MADNRVMNLGGVEIAHTPTHWFLDATRDGEYLGKVVVAKSSDDWQADLQEALEKKGYLFIVNGEQDYFYNYEEGRWEKYIPSSQVASHE